MGNLLTGSNSFTPEGMPTQHSYPALSQEAAAAARPATAAGAPGTLPGVGKSPLSELHERTSSREFLLAACESIALTAATGLHDLWMAPDCPPEVGTLRPLGGQELRELFNPDFPTFMSIEPLGFPGAELCALVAEAARLRGGETE